MTVQQKQYLLAYLGYYTGIVGSEWSSDCEKAAVKFQRDYGISDDKSAGDETQMALLYAVTYGMPLRKAGG